MKQTRRDTLKGSVMIVDDTPANLALLLDLLHSEGFEVLVAENGRSALEQLEFADPDILLLDVMMPGLDGFETCERIKALPRMSGIPVLFMTALTDPVDKLRGFSLGAVDYVTKPVFPEEVLARLRAHLEIRRLQVALQRQNQQLAEEVRIRREAEDELEASLDQAVVIAEPGGRIRFATRLARRLLSSYFESSPEDRLPGPLDDFLKAGGDGVALSSVPPVWVLQRGASRLEARLVEGHSPIMLILSESSEVEPIERLQGLGITPREAEVLFWLAQGKTSPEIALIVGAASNTVKKHIANLYPKLGVETRTAACRLALETLAGGTKED